MSSTFVSSLTEKVHMLINSPFSFFQYQQKTTLVMTSLGLSAFILYPWANQNYHEYIALGPGGLPQNLLGWAVVTALKTVEGETLSTDMYDKDLDKSGWLREGNGVGEIPKRKSVRPKTGWHCIPHRQLNQIPNDDVKDLLQKEFRSVAQANTHVVEVKISAHEKVAESALREIAHIHTMKDSSMHVVLSPQDCKLVIEQGWGERHPISGRVYLPKEYLFIYAPQTPNEVRVHGLIMRAAVKYMTGREDVF